MKTGIPAALAAVAVLAVALFTATPSGGAAANPREPVTPKLTWTACHDEFQCATARVPLDYREPGGRQIDIALLRRPATDPAHRIGTLFVNGGGPSAQIDPFVAQYAELPAAWRANYDILTFDPRGFGYSTAVRCYPNAAAETAALAGAPDPFPVGAAPTAAWQSTYRKFDATCAANADPGLLTHDSTADVARDLDLLRRAIGDPVLNYVGLSYGTLLGAEYANLFPGSVGRMILDGNVDPAAWTTSTGASGTPSFLREGSDTASAATLAAFLDRCGAAPTSACGFSAGTPAATTTKFDTLLDRLRATPVTLTSGGQSENCGYACAVSTVPAAQVGQWKQGAELLQQLWVASTTGSTVTVPSGPSAPPPADYSGVEQHFAVLCSDSPNPRSEAAYSAAAQTAAARSGPEAYPWAWATEPCADWPHGVDGYSGPWNRPTAGPILLVANTGDPATGYADAVSLSHELADARLLTVNGYGHTELTNPSACAAGYEQTYLLTGTLPPTGTVCPQDTVPFG